MIALLKSKGYLRSAAVAEAFRLTPRHLFVPEGTTLDEAYADKALPFANEVGKVVSSISQPTAVAIMLELLELKLGQKVLEIGLGTGYNAALMAHLVGEAGVVTSVDIEVWLVERAQQRLNALNPHNILALHSDGATGSFPNAPFDRIMVTAGVWDIPQTWADQLAPGGRVLLPLNMGGSITILLRLEKVDDRLEGNVVGLMDFILMRGERAKPADAKPSARVIIQPGKKGEKARIVLER